MDVFNTIYTDTNIQTKLFQNIRSENMTKTTPEIFGKRK